MSLIAVVHWFRGCVAFEAAGKNPEKLLNSAVQRGIPLWQIERRSGALFACTTPGGYHQLRFAVRKTGLRLRNKKRSGFPFLAHRFRRRWGVLPGLVLFFVLIRFLSMFIWNINVTGGDEAMRRQVTRTAASLGVASGTWKNSVSLKQIREDLLREIPELSWASMNLTGCELNIELRERSLPPQIVPTDRPCNLKARIGGVVIRVDARAGFAVVSPGDTVVPGDLLVSGVRQDAFGATMLRHAQGEVIAATTHRITCEIPLTQKKQIPTGETFVRRRLAVFGVEIPLNLTSPPQDGVFTRTFSEEPVEVLGVRVPVRRYTETWSRVEEKTVTLTEQEAADQAERELQNRLTEQFPLARVVSSVKTRQIGDGVLTLTAVLQCEENIAQEEQIYLEE
ncbi:MAG: sporulation protein YqfD [Firmicutes bacterium]|nr:sporulation protein YqfD [Bacillota bacterium]